MSMTVQQAIDNTREIMNATGSDQWSDTTLKTWVGVAHWAEWADLLNVNNQYRMQNVSVTQDSNGQFTIASLSTGSGNTKKYMYRIEGVAQPATPSTQFQYFYRQARWRQYPNPQPNTALPYVWYQFGDVIQILPVAAGQGMQITVSWRPTRADNLAALSDVIDFPEGYENVIPWRAAVLALTKGGSEVQAAGSVGEQWQILHDAFLLDLGRIATWPIVADAFDDPSDWGG